MELRTVKDSAEFEELCTQLDIELALYFLCRKWLQTGPVTICISSNGNIVAGEREPFPSVEDWERLEITG